MHHPVDAGADVKGTSGQLVVRVTDGMDWKT
jgi:hypothetical protein